MTKKKRRSNCAINVGLEIYGDKWTLLILRDIMLRGKHYFGEFLKSEENIATNVLTDRLAAMESNGLIAKSVDESNRSKLIYRATPKGIDLLPLLVDMLVWGQLYDQEIANDKQLLAKAANDREGLIAEVKAQLLKEWQHAAL